MRKPCTDCPHNKKSTIVPTDGGRRAVWHHCRLGLGPNQGGYLGYYEKIENCADYAEYLAWMRVNRKKRVKQLS